ncbi:MAG TPA: hypothetical protein VMZ28_23530 [Kofleriaceae bacterium]|nr:hypothetical protein [Kofleriaceae bacterium]
MRPWIVSATLMAAASTASAGTVRHVPLAEAEAGDEITVEATADKAWESTIRLHVRPVLGRRWTATEFQRRGDKLAAVIPADQVLAPAIEYYIDSVGKDGAVVAEFASADDPHRVIVRRSAIDVRRDRELARYGGRRSRVEGSFEWVDFGTRRFRDIDSSRRIVDRYYRVDGSYSFLILAYPLKAFRIGYTRLLGTTPDAERQVATCIDVDECDLQAGFKVGGWSELRFSLRDGFEIDARGSFMATRDGFNVGGRGELRLGVEDGNHVALGIENLAEVGTAGFFRLGWDTVPLVPMTITVELLDYPADRRATGVRLVYGLSYWLQEGVRIGASASYQARDEQVGAFGGGVHAGVDF